MPTVHKYVKQPVEVEAIQVHPSAKTKDLEEFCPSLEWNHHNGVHFPQEGRPEQELPGQPFFWIQSREGRVHGYMYDWILKGDGGNFWINGEAYFATNYKAA